MAVISIDWARVVDGKVREVSRQLTNQLRGATRISPGFALVCQAWMIGQPCCAS